MKKREVWFKWGAGLCICCIVSYMRCIDPVLLSAFRDSVSIILILLSCMIKINLIYLQ
ncbi:hypothetical protein BZA70DRAFT_271494 [Myxozyma melibiosi]|uniref:Uncharacterized protein n=1 Tax=Myxozyma melibiosi TaxID=54550 RepID=A0ABR1FEA9_9ASCO